MTVYNHSTASGGAHPRPPKVYIFETCVIYIRIGEFMTVKRWLHRVKLLQKSGTMSLLLFCDLCHNFLRMLSSLLSEIIKDF